jgi:hypothetical protein
LTTVPLSVTPTIVAPHRTVDLRALVERKQHRVERPLAGFLVGHVEGVGILVRPVLTDLARHGRVGLVAEE